MKPFNLKTYLENPSREVCMIGDSDIPVRIICTDAKGEYPIIALIALDDATAECPFRFTKDGLFNKDEKGESDLYFKPVKKSGWINIYTSKNYGETTGSIYKTKEEALRIAAYKRDNYLDTIFIEWEE